MFQIYIHMFVQGKLDPIIEKPSSFERYYRVISFFDNRICRMRASASMPRSIWPALRLPPSETLWQPTRSRPWMNNPTHGAVQTDNIDNTHMLYKCPGWQTELDYPSMLLALASSNKRKNKTTKKKILKKSSNSLLN